MKNALKNETRLSKRIKQTLYRVMALTLMMMLTINSIPFPGLTPAEGLSMLSDDMEPLSGPVDERVDEIDETDLQETGLITGELTGDMIAEAVDPTAEGEHYRYILGDSTVLLTEIMYHVGYPQDPSQISKVEVTNTEQAELLDIEACEQDYRIAARAAFDEIELTITAEDEIKIILMDGRVAGEPTEEPEPEPTEEPDPQPTEEPAAEPTEEPEAEPTEVPEAEPTEKPAAEPTEVPDAEPTEVPEAEPTEEPAAEPTEEPAAEPTEVPEAEPTAEPTVEPTEAYTAEPVEAPLPAQSFEGRGGGIHVAVDAPEGAFPEGTQMRLVPVYMRSTISEIVEVVSDDFVEVQLIYAVDISFWWEGEEIEPRVPISVVMEAEGVEKDAQTVVVHVDDEGKAEVVANGQETEIPCAPGDPMDGQAAEEPPVEASLVDEPVAEVEFSVGGDAFEEAEDIEGEPVVVADPVDAKVKELRDLVLTGFEADDFSIYALVVTQAIEKLYIDAEGATWRITVGYGADAGISANAELVVQEVEDAEYLAEAERLLPMQCRIAQARFFDIAIMDGGEPVQPAVPVDVCVTLEDAPEDRPSAIHFGEAGGELLSAAQGEEGVDFSAERFSVYGIVYTVDFQYMSFAWSMVGGSTVWLSTLLEMLNAEFDIADVMEVRFTNPSLLEIIWDAEENDWLLRSLAPFTTTEKLTLILADGTLVEIAVTDDQEQLIAGFLTEAEFLDGGVHVGGSNDPNPMLVRPGHTYTLLLTFTEDEHDSTVTGQFTENGIMRYALPDEISLPLADRAVTYFDVFLDRKNTLVNNEVTYYAPANGQNAYIEVKWNAEDRKKLKMLNASPRATFTLNFEVTIPAVNPPDSIRFSDDVTVDIIQDPNFTVDLEKSATLGDGDDKSIIRYAVLVKSDGMTQNAVISDVMGEALTYQYTEGASGVTVEYGHMVKKAQVEGEPEEYEFVAYDPSPYAASNITDLTQSAEGFSLKLVNSRLFDTFVNDTAHPMVVKNLYDDASRHEQCIPYTSSESHDVMFRFYKSYVSEGSNQNVDGLYVPYFLALDHDTITQMAQDMVDAESKNSSRTFTNRATWDIEIANIDDPTDDASVTNDLKPISKSVDYDPDSELARYTIVINPMKLTMNNGERFKMEDVYTNLAVDFETVQRNDRLLG